MARAIFPAPDHDHDRCASTAVAHAEAQCAARGQRLTPIRRQVLDALLGSHKPLGAYEIMEQAGRPRPAPITIYRALDFLMTQGLVHRIASRNAFLACVNNHSSEALVAFLICENCGAVGEAAGAAISQALGTAARQAGFTPKMSVVEISGLCGHCRSRAGKRA
jgi:Fur family transcriptional regulator, zinc uptake regulator